MSICRGEFVVLRDEDSGAAIIDCFASVVSHRGPPA
jgi:hypothetical protein